MDAHLQQETERLTRSWMKHDPEMLRDYLVSGVEDPRINVQSIITRHFLAVALFGDRFAQLIEHELRFALVMNWAREILRGVASADDLSAIRHALATGADNAEGFPLPRFVSQASDVLPVRFGEIEIPNYVSNVLNSTATADAQFFISEEVVGTFQRIWAQRLLDERPTGITVLEPACGSANDYRFLEAFGLGRLIEYTGLDLCEKNIINAKAMFPQARFGVGNVFDIERPDQSVDYCIVHDLFEHLSLEGLEQAIQEICRVTRQGMCLGFFNLHEGEEHIVQPLDEYHWNRLSVPQLRTVLEGHGFEVQIVHIDTFLRWRFGCSQTHNKNAYTFIASRDSFLPHHSGKA